MFRTSFLCSNRISERLVLFYFFLQDSFGRIIFLGSQSDLMMQLLTHDENDRFNPNKILVHNISPYAIISLTRGDDNEEINFRDLAKTVEGQSLGLLHIKRSSSALPWAAQVRLDIAGKSISLISTLRHL
jgi:hypothetical protein